MARANAAENRLATMTTLAERLVTLGHPTAASRSKPIEVRTPEEFTGSQSDLKRFENQLSLVLADEARFPDEQHKLCYCFSLLKGDAYATMEPFLGPMGIDLANTAAFLAEITHIFSDSDEEKTAARELEKLKQGNRDFSRYYADFVRLSTMIPDMGEKAEKRALERGLSSELLDLQYQDAPVDETPAGLVDRLKRMDERIRRRKGQTKPERPDCQACPTHSLHCHGDPPWPNGPLRKQGT